MQNNYSWYRYHSPCRAAWTVGRYRRHQPWQRSVWTPERSRCVDSPLVTTEHMKTVGTDPLEQTNGAALFDCDSTNRHSHFVSFVRSKGIFLNNESSEFHPFSVTLIFCIYAAHYYLNIIVFQLIYHNRIHTCIWLYIIYIYIYIVSWYTFVKSLSREETE